MTGMRAARGGARTGFALVAIALLVMLTLTGCSTHIKRTPNATDFARLAQLIADPLLTGGRATPALGRPNTSANWNVRRASVVRDVTADHPVMSGQSIRPVATEALAEVRDAGWTVVSVECRADGRGLTDATVVALKSLDGFTGGLVVTVAATGWSARAYAPFHLEKDDPWKPRAALDTGSSCLEVTPEPTTDSTDGPEPNVAEYVLI